MRRIYLAGLGLSLSLSLSLLLTACSGFGPDVEPDTRPTYRPVLMSRQQLETAVAAVAPRELHAPGKLFVGSRYLFINELYQGIHVYDNADPAKPRAVAFLRIPGNVDLAVRGNLLYADNGPDLVVIDLSDPARAQLVGRTRDALPELAPPVREFRLGPEYDPDARPANSVIVGWEKAKP